MYVIVEEGPAIFVLVLSAILLGTFPVAFNWVELHGRKPAHTFLDFSAAFFLTAVPCSLALSCTGPKWSFAPGFLVQLSEENTFLVVCACLAGVFLMLGTMCLQYGLAYAGLAVCLPYQIAVSISVGMGVDWLMDTRMAKAQLLWVGLAFFSISTFLGTLAHVARLKAFKTIRDRSIVGKVVGLEDLLRQRQSLIEATSARSSEVEVVSLASSSSMSRSISPTKTPVRLNERADSSDAPDVILDLESPAGASRRAKSLREAGATIMQDTNAFQEEPQPESPKALKAQYPMRAQYTVRAIEVTKSKPLSGIIVLSLGGLCFGLLTPLFFIATSSLPTTDHWRILPDGTPPLTVYNAFFFMTVSFFFLAWGWNLSLLYKPLLECEESSMLEYALDWHGRLASCTAGWACGVGMALQFMGGLGGGYYVADLVKLYPLLAAAWGVMLFKEFKGVGRKATWLFGSMCGAYLLGVILLAFSRNHGATA